MDILYKTCLKRLLCISVIFSVICLYNMCSVTATENPLLLLSYREIDSTHFFVDIKVKDIGTVNGISVPVAFNNHNVSICGYDAESGQFLKIEDGVKTKEEYTDIKKGIELGEFFADENQWDCIFIANEIYPFVKNSEGIFTFTLFGIEAADIEGEKLLISVCFERLNEGKADIRIATSENAESYDNAAPDGAMFLNLDGDIPVELSYDGEVFSPDYKLEPPGEDDTENNVGGDSDEVWDDEETVLPKDERQDEKNDSAEGTDNKNAAVEDEQKTEDAISEKTAEEPSVAFNDLTEEHWAYEMIRTLAEKKIVNGYSDGDFRPGELVKRAEFIKMMVSAMEIPADENEPAFADSSSDSWYNRYLLAALKEKFIAGYPDNTFRPEKYITREDLCVILYRAMSDASAETGGVAEFADFEEISDYAKDAVKCLSSMGIISGYKDGTFRPKNNATRAETAKLVYSCMVYLDKF